MIPVHLAGLGRWEGGLPFPGQSFCLKTPGLSLAHGRREVRCGQGMLASAQEWEAEQALSAHSREGPSRN